MRLATEGTVQGAGATARGNTADSSPNRRKNGKEISPTGPEKTSKLRTASKTMTRTSGR